MINIVVTVGVIAAVKLMFLWLCQSKGQGN